ncbi:MAG: GreA/GreB family elongation factor [Verrucomicrobiota bacterium]
MNSFLYLSNGDLQRLQSILDHLAPGPWPNQDQSAALREVIARAAKARDPEAHPCVGLLDEISLISSTDAEDRYDFSIVMPADANTDEDRLSVLQSVSLAVLGRRVGDLVSWECPRGVREMRIAKVKKFSELVV